MDLDTNTIQVENIETIMDETVMDETVMDETVMDETVMDETVMDETVMDETVMDEAVMDEAIMDEIVMDEAIIDETTVDDELINKFQRLMKNRMTKKTFDLRKHAERLSREDDILKQRDGIFTFFKIRTEKIISTYFENPGDSKIIVSPWRIFNRETGDREEIGNRFEIFKWTLKFRRSKSVPFNISSYFRDKDRREQMVAGLSQEFQRLLGDDDVHFRVFYASKQNKSRDTRINVKECTFHLNLHVPYYD
jgi:hypothetical protein